LNGSHAWQQQAGGLDAGLGFGRTVLSLPGVEPLSIIFVDLVVGQSV
jgi:hypothetical protein